MLQEAGLNNQRCFHSRRGFCLGRRGPNAHGYSTASDFMPGRKDIKGQRFGMLVAMRFVGINSRGYAMWECLCDCGNTKAINGSDLRRRSTVSCGCFRAVNRLTSNLQHGKSYSRVYKVWHGMFRRCYSQNDIGYHNYGGRGITVCQRWWSFENFLADMGEPGAGLTIERIDTNGNYEPANCKWATPKEQQHNRRDNVYIECYGVRASLEAWAAFTRIKYQTLWKRLRKGWSASRTLGTPVKGNTCG